MKVLEAKNAAVSITYFDDNAVFDNFDGDKALFIFAKVAEIYVVLFWLNFSLVFTVLTLPVPYISESCTEKKKKKLNFYFHTSLWCLKRLLRPS